MGAGAEPSEIEGRFVVEVGERQASTRGSRSAWVSAQYHRSTRRRRLRGRRAPLSWRQNGNACLVGYGSIWPQFRVASVDALPPSTPAAGEFPRCRCTVLREYLQDITRHRVLLCDKGLIGRRSHVRSMHGPAAGEWQCRPHGTAGRA
jgi:hypothetical protein